MKKILGVLICAFLAATVYIASAIVSRQQVLRQVAHHNDAWAVGQAVSEFMRLEAKLAIYNIPGQEASLKDVRLRLDIFISRLSSLSVSSLHADLTQNDFNRETLEALSSIVGQLDAKLETMTAKEMAQVIDRMTALNGPLIQLSSYSVQQGWSKIDDSLEALENLHRIYVGVLALLISAWCLLLTVQIRQNSKLKKSQKKESALNAELISKRSELTKKNDYLEYAAHHDALTGLTNRTYFWTKIEELIEKACADEVKVHLILLDLNDFKGINDTLGHDFGDMLLSNVGERIIEFNAKVHVVSRLGGDEFACAIVNRSTSEANELAHSLQARISEPYLIMGREARVGCSIGISFGPSIDCSDASALFKQADLALYHAKARRGNHVVHFQGKMLKEFDDRKALERDLHKAIERDEFELLYQAQVDVVTLELRGLEALCRWNHRTRGVISPLVFIPIAEKMGLIGKLGQLVLEKACEEAVTWKRPLKIAVNISPLQLLEQGFRDKVAQAISRSRLAPQRLELEITETVMLSDRDRVITVLNQLRASGVTVALDDFGTGYSSLAALRDLPFDTLKLDKRFVRDVASDRKSAELIRLVAGIGNSLGKTVIVEGVETRAQHESVRAVGSLVSQGFLFARPVRHERLAFLRENGESIDLLEELVH